MLLSNRYEINQELSEGGFGKTYLAIDTQLPRKPKCVVKELKPLKEIDFEEVLKRFEHEAEILDKLGQQHPQIPQLFAYFADGGKFYLVQEFIEGQTLATRIAKGGALSEMDVYRLLCQILPVLSYIHQEGVIHRDIKPDNIILRASDGVPVLIDFGAVKEKLGQVGATADPTSASRTISIGTLGFMSTEQGLGRPVFSSDLFSLGMTAIYALTARGPQSLPTNPSSGLLEWKNPGTPLNISSPFAAILDRAIQPFANQRYSSANEMLAELEAINRTQPTPTIDINRNTIPPTRLSNNSPTPIVPPASDPAIAETTYSPGVPQGVIGSSPSTGSMSDTGQPASTGQQPVAPGNVPYRGSPQHNSSVPEEPKHSKFPWVPIGVIGTPIVLILASIGFVDWDEIFNSNPPDSPPPSPPPTPNFVSSTSDVVIDCSRTGGGGDYCDFTLAPGFESDPAIGTGVSGGEEFTDDCGFIDTTPDHIVTVTEEFSHLVARVESPGDVTLLIDGPDGRYCSDDAEGVLPSIYGPWPAGTYEVWIGDWEGADGFPYSLVLTELE